MQKKSIFFMDVDGTLTDGKINIGSNGEVFKSFNAKDGFGIVNFLPKLNMLPAIITGRKSKIVAKRAKELGIKLLYQNCSNKLSTIQKICNAQNILLKNCAYVGDDLNDYDAMCAIKNAGGFVACPADADKKIKNIASLVASKNGGNGAVREIIDFLLEKESNCTN